MKKLNLEQVKELAQLLKSYFGNTLDECSCDINVIDEGDTASIEVIPSELNVTGCIYHCEEIVDFCRGRQLNCWIGAREGNGRVYAFAHIF